MMYNILDYIAWRGDLKFSTVPFQEVDALILCELAYVEWPSSCEGEVSLPVACEQFFEKERGTNLDDRYAYSPNIPKLIKAVGKAQRYEQINILGYQSVFDEEQEIQFAAVTFRLPNGDFFIAYRGTDTSILGWKEDMKMTYQDEIPSQQLAWNYAHRIYETYFMYTGLFKRRHRRDQLLYLGGHSKGGNLAMYAAVREKMIYPSLAGVYNFDGPGFRPSFYERFDVSDVLQYIHAYLPSDTVIGRLLSHKEQFTVIEAQQGGLSQHDPFYWSIRRSGFVPIEAWSEESDRIHAYIDKILMSKDDEQRKIYIDLIFRVLNRLEIHHITDFSTMGLRQGMNGIIELGSMSQEERHFMFDVINFLWEQTRSVLLRPNTIQVLKMKQNEKK